MYRYLYLILFNFFVYANHCPNIDGTEPIREKQKLLLEQFDHLSCINNYTNLDSDTEGSIGDLCYCQDRYERPNVKAKLDSDEIKLKAVGRGILTELSNIGRLMGEIDTIFPQGQSSLNTEQCNIKSILKPTCSNDSRETSKRLELAFGFYLSETKLLGIKGAQKFSMNNLRKKITEEAMVFTGQRDQDEDSRSCVAPSNNFLYRKEQMSSLNTDELSSTQLYSILPEIKDENLSFVDGLLTVNNDEDLELIQRKLNLKCSNIKKQLSDAVCKKENGDFLDIVNNINETRASDYLNNVDFEIAQEDLDYTENALANVYMICEKSKEPEFLEEDSSGDLDLYLEKNFKQSGVHDDFLYKESSEKFTGITSSAKFCSQICIGGASSLYKNGRCELKDLNIVYQELKCNNLDELHEYVEECTMIDILKRQEKEKILKIVVQDLRLKGELTESKKEEIRLVIPNFNFSDSYKSKSGLLAKFYGLGTEEKVDKNDNVDNVRVAMGPSQEKPSAREEIRPGKAPLAFSSSASRDKSQVSDGQRAGVIARQKLNIEASLAFSKGRKDERVGTSKTANDIKVAKQSLSELLGEIQDLKNKARRKTVAVAQSGKPVEYKNRKRIDKFSRGNNNFPGNQRNFTNSRDRLVNSSLSYEDRVNGQSKFNPNPSKEEVVRELDDDEQLPRTDIVGEGATGVSSTDESIKSTRSAADKGTTSEIAKLFAGEVLSSSVREKESGEIVEVRITGDKEINLVDLLKNRDEIVPGRTFIIYEIDKGRKVEVTLIPTFVVFSGVRKFSGYRPKQISSQNRSLVKRLKAFKNLLI